MTRVLVIGGTRFVGRHTVVEFRAAGYDVTIFNRGRHPDPFGDEVARVCGDRTDERALRSAAEQVRPDAVVDCVAYSPEDVRTATDIFADVDAYVYVSTGVCYVNRHLPKREGETPLKEYTSAVDEENPLETYPAKKAAGDRRVSEAAQRGVNAMSVRPPLVYGPYDYTGRLDYWTDRVLSYEEVLVPGDGTSVWHTVYVEDLATAIRLVAEEGTPGAAYNVANRRVFTLDDWLDAIASETGREVTFVHAGERELGAHGISPEEFPLYAPYPHMLDTSRIATLGWTPTPVFQGLAEAISDFRRRGEPGEPRGPSREKEEAALAALESG